jgi:hypothetical protein
MDIKSILDTKFSSDLDLYDISRPSFVFRSDLFLKSYTVKKEHEMRIDLMFQDIYNLQPNEVGLYLENIDVICYINNIDNPLNIKAGLILIVPSIDDFEKFRVNIDTLEEDKLSIRERLVVPNKTTRKDKDREDFKKNGFSLPPVVMDKPRPPVRISNGLFSVGGI